MDAEQCSGLDMNAIGPGRGVLAAECKEHQIRYWAVDQSQAVLAELPKELVLASATHVPPIPTDRKFGAIVAEAVLEHMSGYAEAVQFVRSCHDHLIPGGRLILRFPEIRFSGAGFWEYAPDHQYVTSLPRVCALCIQNGFRVVASGHFVDCFTGVTAHVVWRLSQLIPTRMLHRLTSRYYEKSLWSKIGEKAPQGYLVCRKCSRVQDTEQELKSPSCPSCPSW